MNVNNPWLNLYVFRMFIFEFVYLYLGNILSTMSRKKLIAPKHTIGILYWEAQRMHTCTHTPRL